MSTRQYKKFNFLKTQLWIPFLLYFGFTMVSCVKIKTFIPQGGQVGSKNEIIGSGFSSDTTKNEVTFGGINADVLYASSEILRVEVPNGVTRAKIKVSRGWFNSAESKTDFIPLPDYIKYKQFYSETLGITQGYWIMYPPSFFEEGKRFPVIYALHGYTLRNPISPDFADLLEMLGWADPGEWGEHSWVFSIERAGNYFPFVAQSMMQSNSASEFREILTNQLSVVAGKIDQDKLEDVVESITHYLPDDPDSWLSNIAEMIIVMPDGDNSYYADRLGPPEGRNEEGIGAEPSFPTSPSESPAGRLDLHVTGWYERYIMQDLFEDVEIREIGLDKLVEEDSRRFIMGISMGGGGSLNLAVRHPNKFVAVASLGAAPAFTDEFITSEAIYMKNLLFPEQLDVFGSAPLPFNASQEEVEAKVHLDRNYISAHNPWDILEPLNEIDLHFFIEIGENDISDSLINPTIERAQEFIDFLKEKGIPVEGGIVPAASEDEPDNGNADHNQRFWRTRLGVILKFFSDVYQAKMLHTKK